MLRKSDFDFELPEELIAQFPAERRSASRLLHVAADGLHDRQMTDLPQMLRPGDLLVFNDTRVIPARLHGHKDTGGKAEILVERVLGEKEILAQLGVSKTPAPGRKLQVAGETFEVIGREGDLFSLRFLGAGPVMEFLHRAGELPLPPYIHHTPQAQDSERYQTVFARAEGAVAAPTAGLHFDAPLLEQLDQRGVRREFLTLHVGAGTFQPLRVEDLAQHRMHQERFEVSVRLCQAIEDTRRSGGRVVAVGTTVVRALESARDPGGRLQPVTGETSIFIRPGYRITSVDLLLTNFHLPQSTLLMLVSAYGGFARMIGAYRHAVKGCYRFFSYGDAMLIEPQADFGPE